MSIYFGTSKMSLIAKGHTLITEVYKGSQLVYRLGFDPITFTDSGSWVVPSGIKQIRVDCVAAQGFTYDTATGGLGGRVQCVLSVTPKQTLYINVGKQHQTYNDGTYDASDIRTASGDLTTRLVVAGAGGGGAATRYLRTYTFAGGAGGGLIGEAGGNVAGTANNNATIGIAGLAGSQETGGARGYFSMYLKALYAKDGEFGLGGACNSEGGSVAGRGASGYGGAGYYGGGGGVDGYYWASSSAFGASCAAAGGGSSYTHPTLCSDVVHTQGFQTGNGYITISMV